MLNVTWMLVNVMWKLTSMYTFNYRFSKMCAYLVEANRNNIAIEFPIEISEPIEATKTQILIPEHTEKQTQTSITEPIETTKTQNINH